MQIKIVKPGMLSTIQDMGRRLYLSQAVPVSGAMDTLSARIANIALGNTENAAVIELTYANAQFKTVTDILIAYAGDGALLSLDVGDIPAERPVFIPAGNTITLNNNTVGCRTYLAVAGGWDVPEVLGSRSTYLTAGIGGSNGRALQVGDDLYGNSDINITTKNILSSLRGGHPNYTDWSLGRRLFLPDVRNTIRVVLANEHNWFEQASVDQFFRIPYTLSRRSDRMGYHLEGPVIHRAIEDELLSTAVVPGTIQVTGNGSMVLLMADCQTTGGYPRIAQVAAVDLPLCAQLKPGDAINFKQITRQEAELLYIEREKQLIKLAGTVRNKYL